MWLDGGSDSCYTAQPNFFGGSATKDHAKMKPMTDKKPDSAVRQEYLSKQIDGIVADMLEDPHFAAKYKDIPAKWDELIRSSDR